MGRPSAQRPRCRGECRRRRTAPRLGRAAADSSIRLRGTADHHPARGSRRGACPRSPRDGPRRAHPALLGRLARAVARSESSNGGSVVMDNGANAGRTTERTDREWLSWALQFAQADLKSWQEQDWRDALAEAMAFGASHDESAHAQLPLTMLGPRKNLKLSLEQIETALRSAQKPLRRFIADLEQSIHVPLMDAEIPFKGTCVFFVWAGHPDVRDLPPEHT